MLAALINLGTNKKGTYDVLNSFKVTVPCDGGCSQVMHLGVCLKSEDKRDSREVYALTKRLYCFKSFDEKVVIFFRFATIRKYCPEVMLQI